MYIKDKDIMKVNQNVIRLKSENAELKEKLQSYIPRRRVRRVFKQLKTILEADIQDENKIYLDQLKEFIQKIEKEGPQMAGQDIKTAIEHIIGDYELKDPNDDINKALGESIMVAVEKSIQGNSAVNGFHAQKISPFKEC